MLIIKKNKTARNAKMTGSRDPKRACVVGLFYLPPSFFLPHILQKHRCCLLLFFFKLLMKLAILIKLLKRLDMSLTIHFFFFSNAYEEMCCTIEKPSMKIEAVYFTV